MSKIPFRIFRTSLLLGGPGTGKTFISNLATELLHMFFPNSTYHGAFTHRAARLIDGQTLHSSLALPLDLTDTSAQAETLGAQKMPFKLHSATLQPSLSMKLPCSQMKFWLSWISAAANS